MEALEENTMTTLYILAVFAIVWIGVPLMWHLYSRQAQRRYDRGLPSLERQAQRRNRGRR